MAIVEKRVGIHTYTYEVIYDKSSKKQKWIYQGKKLSDKKTLDNISKLFTKKDIEQIRDTYQYCVKNRLAMQRETIKLMCDRLGIEL